MSWYSRESAAAAGIVIGDINVLWKMSGEILLLAIPTSMLFSSRATFVSLYGTDTKVSALCHDCGVRWTKGAKHVGNPGVRGGGEV